MCQSLTLGEVDMSHLVHGLSAGDEILFQAADAVLGGLDEVHRLHQRQRFTALADVLHD